MQGSLRTAWVTGVRIPGDPRMTGDGVDNRTKRIMGYWEEKRRREDARAERLARKDKEFEAQKLAEHKAWLAERFPKDQRIVYRGFGLVTNNHGYTWTIAGLGYTNLLGLREAKQAVDNHFLAVEAEKEWEELAEL